ncbi:hypothetical protein PP657_gp047 [Bacillus phage BCPST]|uniref:Uncharacterized protein n=1 Tax=Bacillus phage BCPST TaxID=2801506 RepID=A0AAE7P6Z1_9CAUD|nr:hypothetical protein PP657_gp047 [Bacillus phage BCPST]QQO38665.1 hypothetical protein BCPST_047 [Bacillus phage BCPST]QSJ04256.1 hypothetical protein BCP6_051 [Bacillus phage BCP6]
MNKSFKITCGLLTYGFGTVVLFSNNEWHWILLGSIITMLSTVYILNKANKEGN